jgi:hypothetical protein
MAIGENGHVFKVEGNEVHHEEEIVIVGGGIRGLCLLLLSIGMMSYLLQVIIMI